MDLPLRPETLSAEALKNANCTIAKGYYPNINECAGYDIKHSNGEAPVVNMEYQFIAIIPRSTLAKNGSIL